MSPALNNTKYSEERAKFWRDRTLNNLEMLRATYVTQNFSRHTHEGYAIGVIEEGIQQFTYQGAIHRAPARSIVVIHPGEVHTGHAGTPSGWTYRMLYPEVSLVQRATAKFMGQKQLPYFPNAVIQDQQPAAQLRQLHIVIENSTSALERESCFLWTLAQLVTQMLRYIPPVVLTAIAVPAVLITNGGELMLNYTNARLVGAIAAILISFWTKNLLLTIVLGMLVFFCGQWLV